LRVDWGEELDELSVKCWKAGLSENGTRKKCEVKEDFYELTVKFISKPNGMYMEGRIG
jgi:hypothetical protein